jgi:hypothetical protein
MQGGVMGRRRFGSIALVCSTKDGVCSPRSSMQHQLHIPHGHQPPSVIVSHSSVLCRSTRELEARGLNFRNVFEPASRFMCPRDAAGTFHCTSHPLDPFGPDYTEGEGPTG